MYPHVNKSEYVDFSIAENFGRNSICKIKTSDSKILLAHEHLLKHKCPVLDFTLSKQVKELPIIEMERYDSAVVSELLRFLYYKEVNDILVLSRDLICLADELELPELRLKCVKAISDSVSSKIAIKIYLFSELLTNLREDEYHRMAPVSR